MGTRHLIGVVLDGDFKVAQYGQWDGYPGGQGVDILEFLSTADMDKFREEVRKLKWTDEEWIKKAYLSVGIDPDSVVLSVEESDRFRGAFPELSRDTSAGVLPMILDGTVEAVKDSRSFAEDSLFCEWAYVLDLDTNVLEVYEGFQKSAPTKGRWLGIKARNEYGAVELVATYAFSDLPTIEEFVDGLEIDGDDE